MAYRQMLNEFAAGQLKTSNKFCQAEKNVKYAVQKLLPGYIYRLKRLWDMTRPWAFGVCFSAV